MGVDACRPYLFCESRQHEASRSSEQTDCLKVCSVPWPALEDWSGRNAEDVEQTGLKTREEEAKGDERSAPDPPQCFRPALKHTCNVAASVRMLSLPSTPLKSSLVQ